VHVTEGSFCTQRVRVAGHASRRIEYHQRMEEDGVVPGVGVLGDAVLMSSLSRSMIKSMMRWTCGSSNKWRRRSLRIWKTASRREGGGGSVLWCQEREVIDALAAQEDGEHVYLKLSGRLGRIRDHVYAVMSSGFVSRGSEE